MDSLTVRADQGNDARSSRQPNGIFQAEHHAGAHTRAVRSEIGARGCISLFLSPICYAFRTIIPDSRNNIHKKTRITYYFDRRNLSKRGNKVSGISASRGIQATVQVNANASHDSKLRLNPHPFSDKKSKRTLFFPSQSRNSKPPLPYMRISSTHCSSGSWALYECHC
jgi:hypothetical protein